MAAGQLDGSGDHAVTAINPDVFLAEYVLPSLTLYGQHLLEKHLAVNAISQMDTLAEVVATHILPPDRDGLKQGEAGRYRQELRQRWPVLGIVGDAHDCHKHGRLTRASAKEPQAIAAGRPEQAIAHAFFCGETECGGDLTPYESLAVTLNDGTQCEIHALLCEALQAWDDEFRRLGLGSRQGAFSS